MVRGRDGGLDLSLIGGDVLCFRVWDLGVGKNQFQRVLQFMLEVQGLFG